MGEREERNVAGVRGKPIHKEGREKQVLDSAALTKFTSEERGWKEGFNLFDHTGEKKGKDREEEKKDKNLKESGLPRS